MAITNVNSTILPALYNDGFGVVEDCLTAAPLLLTLGALSDRVGWHGLMKPAGRRLSRARGERMTWVGRFAQVAEALKWTQGRTAVRAGSKDARLKGSANLSLFQNQHVTFPSWSDVSVCGTSSSPFSAMWGPAMRHLHGRPALSGSCFLAHPWQKALYQAACAAYGS